MDNMLEESKKLLEYGITRKYDVHKIGKNLIKEDILFFKNIVRNEYVSFEIRKEISDHILKEHLGYIYIIRCVDKYKIGRTYELEKRVRNLETLIPFETILIYSFLTENTIKAEKYLHNKYQHLHHKGEWFNLTQKEIDEICSISDFQL